MKSQILYNQRESGVSLIEAVVALFIFSIGALGLAAMQLTSLASSGDSQQRSMAIWKAQEFVDRMRANRADIATYITEVNNTTTGTIGKDTAAKVVQCGAGKYQTPAKACGAGTAACKTADEKVAYDMWDVFCNPNSGLAATPDNLNNSAENTIGLTNLEIVLKQNDPTIDGNDDHLLVFEWLSREADSNTDVSAAVTVKTSLCGGDDPDDFVDVASNLEVYCVRFRP